jgi:hypothetical protein
VEDEDEPERSLVAAAQPGRVHLQHEAAGRLERHVARSHRLSAGELAHDVRKPRIARQLDQRAPAPGHVDGQSQELAGARVHQDDAAGEVDHEHPLDHAAKDRLQPLALDVQGRDRPEHAPRHTAERVLDVAGEVAALGGEKRHRRPGLELLGELQEPDEPDFPAARRHPDGAEAHHERGGGREREAMRAAGQLVGKRNRAACRERRQRRRGELGGEPIRRARRG